ncbi:MAG: hypothetical protein IT564_02925 [Rhodospirillales bacterium]|nr:hypothetical protein [Rhodospirillales bacterium]
MNAVAPVPLTAGGLSVLLRPNWLKDRYDRITLISHRRHLPHLDPRDTRTLVLSTDWLAWRQCLDNGIACLHFEALLDEWPAARGDPDDIHMRRCDWMFREGRDLTLFHGISLGKLFIRDVAMACGAFERIWHALDRAIRRFEPTELLLHDLRAEHDLLDGSVKVWMVEELAKRHDLQLIARPDVPPADDPGFSERNDGFGVSDPESPVRPALREIYAEAIDTVFRIGRRGAPPLGKVLLVLNWLTMRSLIRSHRDSGLAPAMLAGHMPKGLASLRTWWRDGVALVNPPPARLDSADRRSLAVIRAEIESGEAAPGDAAAAARHLFILHRILAAGRLERRALEVKRYLKLFRRHRFARVVVGDATNGFCRMIADCARAAGVATDELPNGMFVTRQRYDARLGDGAAAPAIQRELSWGPLTDRWLETTGVRVPRVTVGYPALDGLRRPVAPVRFERALILPIYADADDAMAFTSNIFGSLVEVTRALRDFGCQVRVKVHVGPQNLAYYTDVIRQAGIGVPVFKDNLFDRHLEWADFVVGPVNSGAFVETLAAGKPYFPICPSPSQIDPKLLPGVRLIGSASELIERLKRQDVPDRDRVLEDICSFVSIADSSRRFWAVLGGQA